MRLVGLFLVLGILGMMSVMLTAMTANASAQASLAKASSPVKTTAQNTGGLTRQTSHVDSAILAVEPPRKHARKRTSNRCARITATCWQTT